MVISETLEICKVFLFGFFLTSSPPAKIPTDSSISIQVCVYSPAHMQPATAAMEKFSSSKVHGTGVTTTTANKNLKLHGT